MSLVRYQNFVMTFGEAPRPERFSAPGPKNFNPVFALATFMHKAEQVNDDSDYKPNLIKIDY